MGDVLYALMHILYVTVMDACVCIRLNIGWLPILTIFAHYPFYVNYLFLTILINS